MTVLKVFSYTWLTTLPSTHVTRSSEAVLVKYNYNYFFPRPKKHIQGSGKGSRSLPPTQPAAPSRHPEELGLGIWSGDRWPSSVPSQASDIAETGSPPPQPKPSQAPYVAGPTTQELALATVMAKDDFFKSCQKQGIRNLADLQGHFLQLDLDAGLPGKPGTARSRSGSVDSADSSRVTSCGSKKSRARAERDRGPARAARQKERCKRFVLAKGGTWSDNHRADMAGAALAESGSFKGTIARANYMAHINETNDSYVDEGADARVKDALIKWIRLATLA